jgi:hypothetical protein
MVLLDQKFFEGGGDIDAILANKLVTVGLQDTLNETLTELGWEGQTVGIIGLYVAPDGNRITGAEFAVRGPLTDQNFTVQAAKWWDCEKDLVIEFAAMNGAIFRFNRGEMCSEYIGQEMIDYTIKRNGVPLSREESDQLGNFSLRLICHLDKSSNGRNGPHFKVTVLAFPNSPEELENSAATSPANWPGIKIVEAKADMFPAARRGSWGAPCYPILVICDRAAVRGSTPSGENLRFCMAQLLQTAILPTACTNRSGLNKMCQEVRDGDPAMTRRQPDVQWPNMPEPRTTQGE